MNSFFSYNPESRPSFDDLKEDPWLSGEMASHNELIEEMKAMYQDFAQKDKIKK